jgi:hypothetical protein
VSFGKERPRAGKEREIGDRQASDCAARASPDDGTSFFPFSLLDFSLLIGSIPSKINAGGFVLSKTMPHGQRPKKIKKHNLRG